jgi:hypothetical protein
MSLTHFRSTDMSESGSTTGFDTGDSGGVLTPAQVRYEKAMEYLTEKDPLDPTQTRMATYTKKQAAYTAAFEAKTKAYNDALAAATNDPLNTTVAMQRAAYDLWVSEHEKTYNDLVQSAYMDWVTIGKKEEVEYWFAIVDNESAMARVEDSKVRIIITFSFVSHSFIIIKTQSCYVGGY